MTDFKKRFKSWPSTIVGAITIMFSLFLFSDETELIYMILEALACICGIVLIFSKL